MRRALRTQRDAAVIFYVVGVALAGYALFGQDPALTQPQPQFPAGPLALIWTAQRALPLLMALLLAGISYRQSGEDELERRRRAWFAIAAVVAVSGALWATATRASNLPQSPGHALMDAGLGLMAYTVLAYRLLLPARVARRAFYRSLLGSLLTAAYITALLLLEGISRTMLGIEAPLVTVFALVVLVAVIGPLRDAAGDWLDRQFFHRRYTRGRRPARRRDLWYRAT